MKINPYFRFCVQFINKPLRHGFLYGLEIHKDLQYIIITFIFEEVL